MKELFKFIKQIFRILRKIWLIEIKYPRIYPSGVLRSLINPDILKTTTGLFIEENVIIKNPNIKIGKHTYIGNNTFIDSCSQIGAFCSISSDVKIGARNHPLNHISTSPVFYSKYRKWIPESTFDEKTQKTVIIEDDVLISANVIVLNGVTIKRGAVIGAGSVVTKDIPPYAIVGGTPAKLIRYRFSDELIKKIEESKWWEKDDSQLKNNIQYASNPTLFIEKLKC